MNFVDAPNVVHAPPKIQGYLLKAECSGEPRPRAPPRHAGLPPIGQSLQRGSIEAVDCGPGGNRSDVDLGQILDPAACQRAVGRCGL